MMQKIESLTPEQAAQMPLIRQKWLAKASEPIDQTKAKDAIAALYQLSGKKVPAMIFVNSPASACLLVALIKNEKCDKRLLGASLSAPLQRSLSDSLRRSLSDSLLDSLSDSLWDSLGDSLGDSLWVSQWSLQWAPPFGWRGESLWEWLGTSLRASLWASLRASLWESQWEWLSASLRESQWESLGESLRESLRVSLGASRGDWQWESMEASLGDSGGDWLRFSVPDSLFPECLYAWAAFFEGGSVAGVEFDQQNYEVFQEYANAVGWLFPYENLVIVCDRPRKVLWDAEGRIHGAGEPSVQFGDGFCVWSWHGIRLPEKYWMHPAQWQAQWLLKEENAELRRVLLEGIGYGRICQELEATEIDAWREYSLLRIEQEIDVEPIHLLKMTCPSTNHIHVLRTPPEITVAREAIKWCNWGDDPEEHVIAT